LVIMALLHLLNLTLLLASASAFNSPNNAPALRYLGHIQTKANFGSSNIPNAFISTSDSSLRNGVSLSMVSAGVESEIVASIFAGTVGFLMIQDALEVSKSKKDKRAKKSKLASVEAEPEEIAEDIKVDTRELEPEPEPKEVVEKDEVESNNAGKSMEPSTDLNDVKESEVVNVYYVEPAATMESSSTPSSTVDTDTIAVEMKENKQAATMSSDNIFDIKKSIAGTFYERKRGLIGLRRHQRVKLLPNLTLKLIPKK